MTQMASLPNVSATPDTGAIGGNSVAGSVKSALGVANKSLSGEIEHSEAAFVDYLQGLLQPATAGVDTAGAIEGGNALPLTEQITGQAAVYGQPLQTQLTPAGDHKLPVSAATKLTPDNLLGESAANDKLLLQSEAGRTPASLSAEMISKSVAASMNPSTAVKTETASTRLPAASLANSPMLESIDLQTAGLSQLRTSTANAAAMLEMSAGRQVLEVSVPSTTTPVTDNINASLLRSPLPQTGMSTDTAFQPATPTLTESFGRPEWNQGLGRQIMWMVNQNMQSAEIRLNPAHLGPIEVRIEMDDEQVNVAFSSRHAAVREAVEMALPRLREMFESSGISLADANISQHSFAEQRENQLREDASNNIRVHAGGTTEEGAEPAEENMTQLASSNSMIDYYI